MSVTTEISIFPLDKGDHLSEYVGNVVAYIRSLDVEYRLNAMGTVFETDTMSQALDIINEAYKILEPDCNRVYCTAKFDINKNRSNAIDGKIESVEKKIGDVKK